MKYMVLMYSKPAETKAMSTSDLDLVMRKHAELRAIAIAERLLDFHVTAVEVRHIHDSTGM